MGIVVNNEDPDKKLQNLAFHQALHCLPNIKTLQGLKYIIIWKF